MRKVFYILISSLLFALIGSNVVSAAAKPALTTYQIGNDISWPQCNKRLPTGQAFGIVGVNNGLANTTNPCFAIQLDWAYKSKEGTSQPKLALYVNTANPGLLGSWWPSSNEYGRTIINSPYGICDGANNVACAYIYGYAKAFDDANIRGVNNPASYLWWLDVETVNSWEPNKQANAADLEGMVDYFKSIGAGVGLYSTSYQWSQIAGSISSNSSLNNLQSWIPGAKNQSMAKTNCTLAPLTAGSTVTLTQYVSANLDYDYSCI
jgi:hypothetical protein